MNVRRLVPLVLATAIAFPLPAYAAEPVAVGHQPVLSPPPATTLPAIASMLVPIGMAAVAGATNQPAFIVFAPLGFGAGHVIAGDPRRGMLVGGGGMLAAGAGLGLSWLMGAAKPLTGEPDVRLLVVGAGLALTLGPYMVWAPLDAEATAARLQGFDLYAAAPVALPPRPWRLGQAYDALPRVPVVTYARYQELAVGTPYEAIAEQLGRPGEERRWLRKDDHSEALYRWTNADGSYMELTFVDGQLTTKANRDLR